MKLSKRLQTIADLIPENSNIIDVGADHGLLDIYLNKYKNCTCLATDISKPCIEKAKENAIKYDANIQTLVNDGLTNINLNDEIIVISGMGTKKVTKILDRNIKNDLIISSHTKINDLKEFLKTKNYQIIKEINIEDKKIYTIIYAKAS